MTYQFDLIVESFFKKDYTPKLKTIQDIKSRFNFNHKIPSGFMLLPDGEHFFEVNNLKHLQTVVGYFKTLNDTELSKYRLSSKTVNNSDWYPTYEFLFSLGFVRVIKSGLSMTTFEKGDTFIYEGRPNAKQITLLKSIASHYGCFIEKDAISNLRERF